MNLQPEFRALTEAALAAACSAFGARLTAFYLHGSVALGDAIPGVSDLDAMLVLRGAITEEDRAWQEGIQCSLAAQHPAAEEVHLTLIDEEALACNDFACFALRYNATLLYGADIAKQLPCPAPDASMAKSRLAFARHCFEQALDGRQPDCTGPLPQDEAYRARKFARYFVVIEGAYYLMTQGAFVSFHKEDVLPALAKAAPQFADALAITRCVLYDPKHARYDAKQFLNAILMLVKWLFDSIDRN